MNGLDELAIVILIWVFTIGAGIGFGISLGTVWTRIKNDT